jgi:hypothetical protein
MGAQNARNWTASAVIGFKPKSAHNEYRVAGTRL